MENTKATTWITVRVSTSQKARLLNMSTKAGDANPSITIIRKVFGESEAKQRRTFRKRARDTRRQLKLPLGRKAPASRT